MKITFVEKKETVNNEFEVRSLDTDIAAASKNESGVAYLKYLIAGILFGILLVKSEVVSWFRIQEMFRFQRFHMYGVIGSAVVTGIISVWLIKKFKVKTIKGEAIVFPAKKFSSGQVYGGLLFGFGWALTGACPGPLYALIGSSTVVIAALIAAILGTWFYGAIRNRLPH